MSRSGQVWVAGALCARKPEALHAATAPSNSAHGIKLGVPLASGTSRYFRKIGVLLRSLLADGKHTTGMDST